VRVRATAELATRYVELAEDLRTIIGNVSYRTSCALSTGGTDFSRQPFFSSQEPLCYDGGGRIPRPTIATGE
jgi:hypothetical protein